VGGRRPDGARVAVLRVAGLGLVLVGVGLLRCAAAGFGRLALGAAVAGEVARAAARFGAARLGADAVAARVAARTVFVAVLVAVLERRFFRTGLGRNALISAEGNRDPRARATNGCPGQETSSSPIRDQSSPGITKFTIRGVSTMAGSIVFMANTK